MLHLDFVEGSKDLFDNYMMLITRRADLERSNKLVATDEILEGFSDLS